MKEKHLQKRIVDQLNSLQGCKAVVTTGQLEAGCPDVLGTYSGMTFAIEVKTENNQPSQLQRHRLHQWQDAGAATTVAWEGFDAKEWILQRYKEKT